MLHVFVERVKVTALHLKHATHVTGVAFGTMYPLPSHSWSFSPNSSHLKHVNHRAGPLQQSINTLSLLGAVIHVPGNCTVPEYL